MRTRIMIKLDSQIETFKVSEYFHSRECLSVIKQLHSWVRSYSFSNSHVRLGAGCLGGSLEKKVHDIWENVFPQIIDAEKAFIRSTDIYSCFLSSRFFQTVSHELSDFFCSGGDVNGSLCYGNLKRERSIGKLFAKDIDQLFLPPDALYLIHHDHRDPTRDDFASYYRLTDSSFSLAMCGGRFPGREDTYETVIIPEELSFRSLTTRECSLLSVALADTFPSFFTCSWSMRLTCISEKTTFIPYDDMEISIFLQPTILKKQEAMQPPTIIPKNPLPLDLY